MNDRPRREQIETSRSVVSVRKQAVALDHLRTGQARFCPLRQDQELPLLPVWQAVRERVSEADRS